MRMLMIDDATMILIVRHFFNKAGHDLILDEAKSVEEALELVGTHEYDFIFCDLNMPVKKTDKKDEHWSGFRIIDHIVDNRIQMSAKIFVCSGDKDAERRVDETRAQFLLKPMLLEKMLELLNIDIG